MSDGQPQREDAAQRFTLADLIREVKDTVLQLSRSIGDSTAHLEGMRAALQQDSSDEAKTVLAEIEQELASARTIDSEFMEIIAAAEHDVDLQLRFTLEITALQIDASQPDHQAQLQHAAPAEHVRGTLEFLTHAGTGTTKQLTASNHNEELNYREYSQGKMKVHVEGFTIHASAQLHPSGQIMITSHAPSNELEITLSVPPAMAFLTREELDAHKYRVILYVVPAAAQQPPHKPSAADLAEAAKMQQELHDRGETQSAAWHTEKDKEVLTAFLEHAQAYLQHHPDDRDAEFHAQVQLLDTWVKSLNGDQQATDIMLEKTNKEGMDALRIIYSKLAVHVAGGGA